MSNSTSRKAVVGFGHSYDAAGASGSAASSGGNNHSSATEGGAAQPLLDAAKQSAIARQVEDYNHVLDTIGQPNYHAIKSLFNGDGCTPADTTPAINVSFELFETIQARFAATKSTLERTKADLLSRNQQYTILQGEMATLREEYAVLQRRAAEAEERNTQLHQQVAKHEVTVEQLRRELGQVQVEVDQVQERLWKREEELQAAQSRIAEGLVTLSQKDAVITTLRRELGKHGRFARQGENGDDEGAGGEYTAEALQSIAADVEGRTQEARMKLSVADFEAKLRRAEQEKSFILEQHNQYLRHVEGVVAAYEGQCMALEDGVSSHACMPTPYYLSATFYADLLAAKNAAATEGDADDEAADKIKSFYALTLEAQRSLDRLEKISIDPTSQLKDELAQCIASQKTTLQVGADLIGFLSTFEKEVNEDRVSLPEVREEWKKARVPFFASRAAEKLSSGVTALSTALVQLLERENEYAEAIATATSAAAAAAPGTGTARSPGGDGDMGGKGRSKAASVVAPGQPPRLTAMVNATTMTDPPRRKNRAIQVSGHGAAGDDAARASLTSPTLDGGSITAGRTPSLSIGAITPRDSLQANAARVLSALGKEAAHTEEKGVAATVEVVHRAVSVIELPFSLRDGEAAAASHTDADTGSPEKARSVRNASCGRSTIATEGRDDGDDDSSSVALPRFCPNCNFALGPRPASGADGSTLGAAEDGGESAGSPLSYVSRISKASAASSASNRAAATTAAHTEDDRASSVSRKDASTRDAHESDSTVAELDGATLPYPTTLVAASRSVNDNHPLALEDGNSSNAKATESLTTDTALPNAREEHARLVDTVSEYARELQAAQAELVELRAFKEAMLAHRQPSRPRHASDHEATDTGTVARRGTLASGDTSPHADVSDHDDNGFADAEESCRASVEAVSDTEDASPPLTREGSTRDGGLAAPSHGPRAPSGKEKPPRGAKPASGKTDAPSSPRTARSSKRTPSTKATDLAKAGKKGGNPVQAGTQKRTAAAAKGNGAAASGAAPVAPSSTRGHTTAIPPALPSSEGRRPAKGSVAHSATAASKTSARHQAQPEGGHLTDGLTSPVSPKELPAWVTSTSDTALHENPRLSLSATNSQGNTRAPQSRKVSQEKGNVRLHRISLTPEGYAMDNVNRSHAGEGTDSPSLPFAPSWQAAPGQTTSNQSITSHRDSTRYSLTIQSVNFPSNARHYSQGSAEANPSAAPRGSSVPGNFSATSRTNADATDRAMTDGSPAPELSPDLLASLHAHQQQQQQQKLAVAAARASLSTAQQTNLTNLIRGVIRGKQVSDPSHVHGATTHGNTNGNPRADGNQNGSPADGFSVAAVPYVQRLSRRPVRPQLSSSRGAWGARSGGGAGAETQSRHGQLLKYRTTFLGEHGEADNQHIGHGSVMDPTALQVQLQGHGLGQPGTQAPLDVAHRSGRVTGTGVRRTFTQGTHIQGDSTRPAAGGGLSNTQINSTGLALMGSGSHRFVAASPHHTPLLAQTQRRAQRRQQQQRLNFQRRQQLFQEQQQHRRRVLERRQRLGQRAVPPPGGALWRLDTEGDLNGTYTSGGAYSPLATGGGGGGMGGLSITTPVFSVKGAGSVTDVPLVGHALPQRRLSTSGLPIASSPYTRRLLAAARRNPSGPTVKRPLVFQGMLGLPRRPEEWSAWSAAAYPTTAQFGRGPGAFYTSPSVTAPFAVNNLSASPPPLPPRSVAPQSLRRSPHLLGQTTAHNQPLRQPPPPFSAMNNNTTFLTRHAFVGSNGGSAARQRNLQPLHTLQPRAHAPALTGGTAFTSGITTTHLPFSQQQQQPPMPLSRQMRSAPAPPALPKMSPVLLAPPRQTSPATARPK